MTSLNMFKIERLPTENIEKIKDYKKEVGEIGDIKLFLSIENFTKLEEDLYYFDFQHDFRHAYIHRGNLIHFPRSHELKMWISLKGEKTFLFIQGDEGSINPAIPNLKDIFSSIEFVDFEINKLQIKTENLIDITTNDAITIFNSWFKELDQNMRSVFLSGQLKDEEQIHELYEHVIEKAGKITSVQYSSNKLGFAITLNSKGIISSRNKECTPPTLLSYFTDVVAPLL